MRRLVMICAGAGLVAACNRGPEINEKNVSAAEVAAKINAADGGGQFVKPGQWQSKVTIEDFEIPGLSPEAARHMRAAVAQNQQNHFETCLTKADVEQPKGKFFTGNDECRYDHFKMGGGKIDAAMRCPAGGGMTQVMTMTGNYTPTTYDMLMTMTGEGAEGPAAGMKMKMHVLSNRTGECSAQVAQNGESKKG